MLACSLTNVKIRDHTFYTNKGHLSLVGLTLLTVSYLKPFILEHFFDGNELAGVA